VSIPFIDIKAQLAALRDPIEKRIQTVLNHCQFILGPEVDELEKALAKYVGTKHAITCASGTDATIMALMAYGIGPGDEVIVPAFSFIATAETVVLVGATPVYVDVEKDSANMDVKKIEEAITQKTKAIHPVSLYGQPADMDEINAIAKKHGLKVIEDAAQSFGGSYKGKKSCGLSEIGVTSFFPAKPLGCFGDGGAIFTNDDSLAEALKQIRVHGQSDRYYHTRIGVNGRLDTLQCAIMLPKLERFPWEVEQRCRLGDRYNKAFEGLTALGITLPILKPNRTSAWAQYTLQVPKRELMQKRLQEKGVPTAVHYPRTMPDQPAYKENGRVVSDEISRELATTVMSLPMYPDMTDAIQDQVIAAVRDVTKSI
jgi:UDP-2-acetamido-2-deoxy-ribo-hexuluronate aminotransferase